MTASVVVAGMGSEYRRDDGAGPAVARIVATLAGDTVDIGPLGEPLDLLGRWDGAELAVLVDATRGGAQPGSVVVHDLDALAAGGSPAPAHGELVSGGSSTHGIGLVAALAIARAAGRAPGRVVVVGIEGREFGFGVEMSPAVQAAIPEAVQTVLRIAGLDSVGRDPAGPDPAGPERSVPCRVGLGP